MINIPLMSNNISEEDINELIDFLHDSDRFTNGPKVREFEEAWSRWVGMEHSVFVNSGSSANFITLAAIKEISGGGEVVVSPLGWSSDVSAIIAAGMEPVFVDVHLSTFAMDEEAALKAIDDNTKAVLLTHALGYDGMSDRLRDICTEKGIFLIEDTCESHGASHNGRKCGSIGDISNFSFYYAHHMSTIEGGMICTNDKRLYDLFRMFRSHGMLRECDDKGYIQKISNENPDIYPEFIFTVPGYNMRSTEINAVLGLSQLKKLDMNIEKRCRNHRLFLNNIDPEKYFIDFKEEGSSNYAFIVLLREKYRHLYDKVVRVLKDEGGEFRRGTAGGGNLTRQPYIRKRFPDIDPTAYKNVEYIHRYGLYTGNYPDLDEVRILELCGLLNNIR